jgi:cyclopropane-fatty-acyl-phospholipid synthase
MATTDGMSGRGYYDDHSEYQRKVAETGSTLVRACVDAVALPAPGETFVVADYGASTGRNSIAAVRNAIDQVRARRSDQPAAALHNDLPTNDWNEFFTNLRTSADSYLDLAGPPVVPLVSAVSFFEPAAPAGAVHVGVSFSAAHWLRSQPTVVVPEGFYFCEATGAARTALAAQADTDWTAFLEARASDLRSGGRLLVQMVGSEPATGHDHEPRVTARRLLRAMADVAAAMAADGDLDAAAVDRYVLAVYARTPDEASAPLERAGTPVADAFTVVECRTDPVANPYYEKWRSDHDAAAYAAAYAAFVRGFTESSLRTNLFAPGLFAPGSRGKPASHGKKVDDLVDEFFDRLTARFAADPERDRFEDWTLTVVLARR